jgi:hypothetical protein
LEPSQGCYHPSSRLPKSSRLRKSALCDEENLAVSSRRLHLALKKSLRFPIHEKIAAFIAAGLLAALL